MPAITGDRRRCGRGALRGAPTAGHAARAGSKDSERQFGHADVDAHNLVTQSEATGAGPVPSKPAHDAPAAELISCPGNESMSCVLHAVVGRRSRRRRRGTVPERASRHVLVLGAVAVAASVVLVQPAAAQRAPVTDTTPSAGTRTGSGPNASGLIGFVLVGGWVLAGGLLFRQGRRRLPAQKALPVQRPVPDEGDAGGTDIAAEERPHGEQLAVGSSGRPASAAPE